jgi:hypothetical protein
MDILKLNSKWYCSLLVFSGRPDPRWIPKKSIVDELLTIADSAPITNTAGDQPSLLGYRGVVLYCDLLSITAFNGYLYITYTKYSETRTDVDQLFEKIILKNLPKKYSSLNAVFNNFGK